MTRALILVLSLASVLLQSASVDGQSPLSLSCSPHEAATLAVTGMVHQTAVDCVVTLASALGPDAALRASVAHYSTNDQMFVGCSSDAAVTCSSTAGTATFVCPPPEGCPSGSSYIFTILLSSSSSRELFGQLSVAVGPTSGAVGVVRSLVTTNSGWHLVALPPGSYLSGADGPLYTLQAGDQDYATAQLSQGTVAGLGYWVYSRDTAVATVSDSGLGTPASINTAMPIGYQLGFHATLPPGGWALVGNPSGSKTADVDGADAVYTYDPMLGYRLLDRPLLPGEAALAYSAEGGPITVAPNIP